MVAMPCVVTAWVGPIVVSQSSGFSKIRTAPTSGRFLINSKMSSFSRGSRCRRRKRGPGNSATPLFTAVAVVKFTGGIAANERIFNFANGPSADNILIARRERYRRLITRGIVAFNFSPRNLTQVTNAMKPV